jgi:hypothetical protein
MQSAMFAMTVWLAGPPARAGAGRSARSARRRAGTGRGNAEHRDGAPRVNSYRAFAEERHREEEAHRDQPEREARDSGAAHEDP